MTIVQRVPGLGPRAMGGPGPSPPFPQPLANGVEDAHQTAGSGKTDSPAGEDLSDLAGRPSLSGTEQNSG